MAASRIEWTGQTWNPVSGCEAVSPGCAHCYAATMTRRLEAMGQADYAGLTTAKHFNGVVRCLPHKLDIPLKRKKPTTYFVNSMSDLFHEDVPDEFIDKVFAVMALCPQHTFQVLTKRAERMQRYMEDRDHQYLTEVGEFIDGPLTTAQREAGWLLEVYRDAEGLKDGQYEYHGKLPLSNVWLGVSAEDQQRADERIPWLLKTPAAVRFVSAEPLLGPIMFDTNGRGGPPRYMSVEVDHNDDTMLDWIIVGGESGGGSRPCNVEWIRSIVRQCRAAGVPIFCKQLGSKPCVPASDSEPEDYPSLKDKKGGDTSEWPADLRVREMPRAVS